MKYTIATACLVLLCFISKSQDLDARLAEPQFIELVVSTPQPRLNETFQIVLDIAHLRANIFRSLAGKVQISSDITNPDNTSMVLNVKALHKGKNELGPLTFTVDKTTYTTNKISYEVIDALPKTDRGLWFRSVMFGDTAFCIIIEQRIPTKDTVTQTANNTETYSAVPESRDLAQFKNSYSIKGVNGRNSYANSNFDYETVDGQHKGFMYGYSVYYFDIVDKNAKIVITKDLFENIPPNYAFQNLIIR